MRYTTDRFNKSEIIVWDEILFSRPESVYEEYEVENKYPITDVEDINGGGVKGREVEFRVKWEVVPFLGWFARFEADPITAKFPNTFSKVK